MAPKWSESRVVGYHFAECRDVHLLVNAHHWIVRVGSNQESGKCDGVADGKVKAIPAARDRLKPVAEFLKALANG